jgi:hypothetical protein
MSDYPNEYHKDGVTYVGNPAQGYGTIAYSLAARCEELLKQEAHALSDKQRIVIAHEAIQAAVLALGLDCSTPVRNSLILLGRDLQDEYRNLV